MSTKAADDVSVSLIQDNVKEVPVVLDDEAVDPLLYLMEASVTTQQKELGLQAAVANVSNAWADGAYANVQIGDNILTAKAKAMTGTGEDLEKQQVAYQVAQTTVANNNQQFSNIVQGGTTAMTSLTQIMSQVQQFCSIVLDNFNSINGLIAGWGR